MNGDFLELQVNILSNIQGHVAFVHFYNFAKHAACHYNFVTFTQRIYQRLVLFLSLALRANDDEVHEQKKTDQHHDLHYPAVGRTGSVGGLSHGIGNEKTHVFTNLLLSRIPRVGRRWNRDYPD